MQAALECGAPGRAVAVFDTLLAALDNTDQIPAERKRMLRPDGVSYVTAINAAGQSLSMAKAEQYFAEMRAQKIPVEERTWCLMVKASGECMDYAKAKEYFDEATTVLASAGHSVTTLLHNALLKAAGKTFDYDEMERLMAEMSSQGLHPNSVTYNIMLHTLGELKQHDQVLDMYAEMLQKGVRPDGVTFSVLIGAAGRALNLDKAWDHFRECQTAAANASTAEEHDELRPSAITYINLINACEQCGRLDRAFDVFGEMQSAGFTPNSETYCALLHACVEARHEEKVGLALPAPRTHARPAGSPSPWWCPQWTWLLSGRAGDPKVAEVLSELQAKNVQIEPEGITHPPAVHDATQRSHR